MGFVASTAAPLHGPFSLRSNALTDSPGSALPELLGNRIASDLGIFFWAVYMGQTGEYVIDVGLVGAATTQ